MTGCEILIVLTLIRTDGKPAAVLAHPVIPRKCRVTVRFRAKPPVRLLFCPIVKP